MGTTLTGTTPQDTYDSLIKVTDNGPLSATAKYLSDGLGNDSTLALSTTAVGIGTNSLFGKFNLADASNARLEVTPVADGVSFEVLDSTRTNPLDFKVFGNDILFNTKSSGSYSERMRIDPSGNVGIGTSTPECKLHVAGTASGSDVTLYIDNAAGSTLNNSSRLKFSSDTGSSVSSGGAELNCLVVNAGNGAVDLLVKTWTGGAYTEKARFLAEGGLTFNGDTAAANALDDYEEGTWTMGVTIGGLSVGVTYSSNTGTYTKIGRQVTVNGLLQLTSKGSSTGGVRITGLPFTIGGANGNYASSPLRFKNISFLNVYQCYGEISTTTVVLEQVTNLGVVTAITDVDFTNNSEMIISLTYFV